MTKWWLEFSKFYKMLAEVRKLQIGGWSSLPPFNKMAAVRGEHKNPKSGLSDFPIRYPIKKIRKFGYPIRINWTGYPIRFFSMNSDMDPDHIYIRNRISESDPVSLFLIKNIFLSNT